MKKNMAVIDRLVRLLVALVLLILFFAKDVAAPWSYVMLAVAVIFALTGFTGSCPLYRLLRIDTRQFKY